LDSFKTTSSQETPRSSIKPWTLYVNFYIPSLTVSIPRVLGLSLKLTFSSFVPNSRSLLQLVGWSKMLPDPFSDPTFNPKLVQLSFVRSPS